MIFLTVVTIFLLFFLHYTKILRPVENAVIAITRPVIGSVYRVSNAVGENYLSFKSKTELIRQNKDLKDQLTILLNEKSKWLSEEEENKFLREQLNFVQDHEYDYMVASVIGRGIDYSQNTLILDKGTKHGLEVGMPVLADKGTMMGKIIKTNKSSSVVLLINDDLSKVAVKIQNQSKTIGIIEGEFGLGIKMRLIPQTEMITESDIVVTSGLERQVPGGLIVGQIKSIDKEPEELFQEASIESLLDFNKVTLVNVIRYTEDND